MPVPKKTRVARLRDSQFLPKLPPKTPRLAAVAGPASPLKERLATHNLLHAMRIVLDDCEAYIARTIPHVPSELAPCRRELLQLISNTSRRVEDAIAVAEEGMPTPAGDPFAEGGAK